MTCVYIYALNTLWMFSHMHFLTNSIITLKNKCCPTIVFVPLNSKKFYIYMEKKPNLMSLVIMYYKLKIPKLYTPILKVHYYITINYILFIT